MTEHGALVRINLVGEPPTLPLELRSETSTIPGNAAPAATITTAPRRRAIDRRDGNQLPEVEPEDWPDYIPPDD